MKSIVYLLIASVIILVFIAGFVFSSTIIDIYTLGNRVEDNLIAAGWAGFKNIDLDKLAERIDLGDEERRNIYLDKTAAKATVLEYIKANLKLDDSMVPKADSYINYKAQPVILKELEIYNPDDLPATCSKGVVLSRASIHMVVLIPAQIKYLGFKYLEKHVDVDAKSFFN